MRQYSQQPLINNKSPRFTNEGDQNGQKGMYKNISMLLNETNENYNSFIDIEQHNRNALILPQLPLQEISPERIPENHYGFDYQSLTPQLQKNQFKSYKTLHQKTPQEQYNSNYLQQQPIYHSKYNQKKHSQQQNNSEIIYDINKINLSRRKKSRESEAGYPPKLISVKPSSRNVKLFGDS